MADQKTKDYAVQDQRTGCYLAMWFGQMTWTLSAKKAHRYGSLKRARRVAELRAGCKPVPLEIRNG